MAKKERRKSEIFVKILAAFLVFLMLFGVAGTLIFYLLEI